MHRSECEDSFSSTSRALFEDAYRAAGGALGEPSAAPAMERSHSAPSAALLRPRERGAQNGLSSLKPRAPRVPASVRIRAGWLASSASVAWPTPCLQLALRRLRGAICAAVVAGAHGRVAVRAAAVASGSARPSLALLPLGAGLALEPQALNPKSLNHFNLEALNP